MQATNGHIQRTVVEDVPYLEGGGGDLMLYLNATANAIPAWGTNVRWRDQELRRFYKSESYLSGTVFSTTARYASFKFVLSGPPRQCAIMHRMLHGCEHGKGWAKMMIPTVKDYLSQDNAAWLEIIREEDNWRSPVVQLNHLDSSRCWRTGNWETPVVYHDIWGGMHKMKWYQVYDLSEYPDPDERMRGYQECAVSRLLTNAQKMYDVEIYEAERFSGRNPDRVHLVGGIQQERIKNILKIDANTADQMGYTRYEVPSIIAALDPNARVSHEEIILRGAPEGYNKEADMRWYTVLLALTFGLDPQDIAPLSGGNLGSAQQSQVLAQKGRGKGPALFMSAVEQMMNFHGIMPQTVSFHYKEQDDAENEARTNLQWRRTQMYAMLAKPTQTKPTGNTPTNTPGAGTANAPASGDGEPILPVHIVRQMMRDNGDLKQEYLDAMGEVDITPQVDISSDDKP